MRDLRSSHPWYHHLEGEEEEEEFPKQRLGLRR